MSFNVPEELVHQIKEMRENDKYDDGIHEIPLHNLISFLAEERKGDKYVKKISNVLRTFDHLAPKICEVEMVGRINIESLNSALTPNIQNGESIPLPVERPDVEEMMNSVATIASTKISHYLFNTIKKARDAFVKRPNKPILAETVSYMCLPNR